MDVTKIALIAHIEANNTSLNKQLGTIDKYEQRLYETEAIRCFTSWRKVCGWLKDIPIYCLCATKNTPSDKTIKALEALNVKYIEDYSDETKRFTSGFITIPYTGMYFEKILSEDILIKIDLDNVMLKPFPEDLVEKAYSSTIVGRYSRDFEISERYCFNNECPFDTSLIITHKDKLFYKKYYDLCFDENVLTSPEWLSIRKTEGEYWLEEYVVDYMYKNKLADITPIQNYQCGYGYPDMASFVKNKLTGGLYMTHNHI
jgi:hypothetical protein